ncbi:MAG: hypothetical protein IPO63_08005 [Bacteroidetes bacterium]|nr:hypothetical protein [Bacteroidota bacterium]
MMKNWDRVLLSVLFATIFILVHGYQFNNGDQEEHLPYVYKLIDSNLYQNDYLVPVQTSQFSIRFYFAYLIRAGAYLLPIPTLVFLIYFICLCTIGWVASQISERVSKNTIAAMIAPALIILVNNFTVGGNSIIDVQLTCTVIAVALGAMAYSYFTKGKVAFAAAFCGIASLFQLLVGLQLVMLLIISSFLIVNKKRWINSIKYFLIYLIFAGAMLFPLLYLQFGTLRALESEKYFNILFYFRNSNHYHPFCFPLTDYLKTLFWWIIILLSIQFSSKRQQLSNYSILIILSTAGCLLYFIGFTQMNIYAIGKLQWFKATIWPTLFGAIPVSIYLVEKIKVRSMNLSLTKMRVTVTFCIIFMLLLLFNSANLHYDKLKYRYKLGNYPQKDLEKMHHWIAKNTPLNAVFLTLPEDDSFLSEAKRSTPVGYKGIIHQPDFMIPWYEKMKNVYGVELSDKKCRKLLDEAKLIYHHRPDEIIQTDVKIDYRIYDLNQIDSNHIKWNYLIHREGDILLLTFSKKSNFIEIEY